ncbi:hypothetical protein ACQCVE_15690 [Metabacillus sp. 113a]
MFIYSTGQVNTSILNLALIRFDLMNRATTPQTVRVLVWNTAASPKVNVYDETLTVPALNGSERLFTSVIFPAEFEAIVQTNDPNVVPRITGLNALSTSLLIEYKYGDLFRTIGNGDVIA